MKNQIFPEIKTERLTLRKVEESDAEAILFLRSDETINKFIQRPVERRTRTIADALAHIRKLSVEFENNKSVYWGITLTSDLKIIGSICLWNFSDDYKTAEVGYDLNPMFQRKGIMSEALNAVVDYGFTKLKLERIEAYTHDQNESSKRLLEKNGFRLNKDKKDAGNLSNVVFEISSPTR